MTKHVGRTRVSCEDSDTNPGHEPLHIDTYTFESVIIIKMLHV